MAEIESSKIEGKELTAAEEAVADLIAERLTEKWGLDRLCPYCNADAFSVDPSPVFLGRLLEEGRIPHYMVTCGNCGVVTPISAEAIDVWPDEEVDLDEESR